MFAVIFIPDFSLQAVLRHEPQLWSRPVAMIEQGETKAPIFQLTTTARAAGVCEGLTSTQALARCSNILIKSRSLSQEQTAQETLLQTAYQFSPRLETTANGVCTMDLQALPVETKGHGAFQAWAEKLLLTFAPLHLRAQIGIAATPNVALHAARCAKPIFIVQDSVDFISALPVQSLEPTPQISEILHRWGIRTVGAFTALGKDKIAERLGPEGLELFDGASVEEIRPLDLIIPSEHFSETMEFEVEIESLEPLLFILNRFIEQLSQRLMASQFVAQELQLRLRLSSGDSYEHVFAVPSPTAHTMVLFRMLQTHLENVRADSGIIALALSATPTRAENYQFGLFETALRDPNQFSETTARLSALCGNDNVGTPVLQDSHRPDAFKIEKVRFESASTLVTQPLPANTYGLCLRRFRPTFNADVELRHGTPVFISSLKLNSPIEKVAGPFRSSGDWWEQQKLWTREEWDVEIRNGTIYRIYRENQNWFIEGVYD
ncbi:MAG: Nucleotidyltransferase/DNA polymerase [Verrucomicrobiales bacterium]|nr:Nucleotidyltransferase/DNA polymerase [Verrucomicrobiales bacterium]